MDRKIQTSVNTKKSKKRATTKISLQYKREYHENLDSIASTPANAGVGTHAGVRNVVGASNLHKLSADGLVTFYKRSRQRLRSTSKLELNLVESEEFLTQSNVVNRDNVNGNLRKVRLEQGLDYRYKIGKGEYLYLDAAVAMQDGYLG